METKKWNVIAFVISSSITAGVYLYYKFICSTGVCSYNEITNTLLPLGTGACILVLFFAVFLFQSSKVFKKWLKYIFSWGFPLAIYLTYITTGSSSIPAYGKVDVVKFWGIFFGVATIIFIAAQYYRTKKLR
jgi:hypothetical protein